MPVVRRMIVHGLTCVAFAFLSAHLPSSIVRCSDTSFPIQHDLVDDDNNPLGPRSALYEDFIQGCREYYGKKAHTCDETERDRLAMSLRQPQSMQNYTDTGYKKIQAPEPLRKLLTEYWETNKDKKRGEQWSTGNTYTNHWAAPTYMVSVEDQGLRGGGSHLKKKLWEEARSTIEEWTGNELVPTSMYGIRVYTEGAILSPHVDRMPLISSAIVNVAQGMSWLASRDVQLCTIGLSKLLI